MYQQLGKWLLLLTLLLGTGEILGQNRYRRSPSWNSEPLTTPDGGYIIAAVVRDDLKTRRLRDAEKLELWSYYFVYAQDEEGCYLGLPDPETLRLKTRLGWFSNDALQLSNEALRTENKIFRKVIIFDNKYESRIPIYAAPSRGAREIIKAPMFTFFFIYKEVEDFFLIGLAPLVDLEYCSEELLGWIHKDSCRTWNTRQAVGYDRLNREERVEQDNLVKIYKTSEAAISQQQDQVVSQESEELVWKYNMPRYPLLEGMTHEQKRLFNIAFLGGQKSAITQLTISKIEEARSQLSQLDVMFLVDFSMNRDQRRLLAQAIEKAAESLQKTIEKEKLALDVNYGITFYSNFSRGRRYPYKRGKLFQPRVVRLHRFTDDPKRLTRYITNQLFFGRQDEPKSLFYGIDSALNRRARWREGSSRYMVVVGNSGNHPQGTMDLTDVSQLNLSTIQSALEDHRTRVFAMQMVEERKNNEYTQLFLRQMRQLTQRLGSAFPVWQSDYDPYGDGLTDVMKLYFEQIRMEVHVLQQTVRNLEHGLSVPESIKRHQERWEKEQEINYRKFAYLFQKYNKSMDKDAISYEFSELKRLVDRFIQSQQITGDDLRGEGVFYDKGWVWEYHPETNERQVQVYLLMSRMELSRLLGFMSALLSEIERVSKPEQYLEVWKNLLKAALGIDSLPQNEPLDNLIKQRTGLPLVNGLLSYSLEEFVQKAHQQEFRTSLIAKLKETNTRLFTVLTEREVETLTLDDGRTVERNRKRWWKEKETDFLEYAWIEIELFP